MNENSSGQSISTSLFYMWRCVITIAHADGILHAAEIAHLEKIFANMDRVHGMTTEQKATLADDLKNPKNIADLLPHINDPAVRGQLVYFGGLLVRADGEMHPSEETILKKLHADQLAGLDLEAIRSAVRGAVTQETFQAELERGQMRPQNGFMAALDELLLRLGIDIYTN